MLNVSNNFNKLSYSGSTFLVFYCVNSVKIDLNHIIILIHRLINNGIILCTIHNIKCKYLPSLPIDFISSPITIYITLVLRK